MTRSLHFRNQRQIHSSAFHHPRSQHYKASRRTPPFQSILHTKPKQVQLMSLLRTLSTTARFTTRTNTNTQFIRSFSISLRKMGVHNVASKAEFDAVLKENKVVVLDAFATWCGPCKVIAPKVVEYVALFLISLLSPFSAPLPSST